MLVWNVTMSLLFIEKERQKRNSEVTHYLILKRIGRFVIFLIAFYNNDSVYQVYKLKVKYIMNPFSFSRDGKKLVFNTFHCESLQ